MDLIVTSPPYFALRSYRDGGEHYAGQIGSEETPGAFVDALVEAIQPLMDRDICSPHISAWEIDTNHGADGEEMHAHLKQVWLLARSNARLRKLKGEP